jgi:hypothetical protein
LTFSALIDELLSHTDNVSPSDTDYTDRRTRCNEVAIRVISDFIFSRPWRFRQKRSSLLTLSSGAVSVPSDFIELGPYGGVFSSTNGERLRETDEQEVQSIRESGGDQQWMFAIYGQDGSSGYEQLQVPTTAALGLYMSYLRGVPTLDETTNNDKLKIAVPVQYHQSVLIPGCQAKLQRSKGDARSREYEMDYEEAKRQVAKNEKRFRSETHLLPRFWMSR